MLGTILGVWAHPDDETYLSGLIMADAVGRGDRVVCVTATRGEAGSQDHERWPPERMAEIREAELMESLAALGVRDHRWLDYLDGECALASSEEAVAKVAAIMDEVRPDSVLTFGSEGMTGHPDHIAVHQWTTEAFNRTARPGTKLYYACVSDDWAEEFVPGLRELNVYEPGTPPIKSRDELAIYFPGSADLVDQKVRAILAQVSQVEGLVQAFGADTYRRALSTEGYVLGATK